MNIQNCILEYFELEDGEKICLTQYSSEDGEMKNRLILSREVAIQLSVDILELLDFEAEDGEEEGYGS